MNNADTALASGAPVSTPLQQQAVQSVAAASRMSELLRRYPDLQDQERVELVEFLINGHPDALAMATYGAGLVSQATAVKKDHPEYFPSGMRTLLPWLGVLVVVAGLLLLARML